MLDAGMWRILWLPLLAQFAAYFGLARLAFRLPQNAAMKIAAARVVTGFVLFWPFFLLASTVGAGLAVSAPIAWAIAARMDPKRSMRRGVAWVIAGTALTFAVNEGYWQLMMGESVMDMNTRWSFG
jgi:hypothetical protein